MPSYIIYTMLIIACAVYVTRAGHPAPGKCVPEHVSDTIGLVSVSMGVHGKCVNLVEIKGFKQCRGYCHSVDALSKQTGKYEQTCQCCRVKSFTHVPVELTCEGGETMQYNASTPDQCSCRSCGDTWTPKDEEILVIQKKDF